MAQCATARRYDRDFHFHRLDHDQCLACLHGIITPAEYLPLLKGTKLLTLDEGRKVYEKGKGYQSLYGSTEIADTFNWYNKVYSVSQNIGNYIDPSFMETK